MKLWAVIPAAGSGSRMSSTTPKQYLQLSGRPVLLHTLQRLAALPELQAMVVAIAEDDPYWTQIAETELPRNLTLISCAGGADRYQSVLNGLDALQGLAGPDDPVLVHDAVRPCVRIEDIQRLLREHSQSEWGALLATPVADTLKQADARQHVRCSQPRDDLWAALTPQVFPFALLQRCLHEAREKGRAVTDESAAIEQAGGRPRLVPGNRDNIKITWPEDLLLAEEILRVQQEAGA